VAPLLKRHLRFWVRSFWGVVLFAVISLAVLVQLGRALFPVLDDYRELAEQQLSEQLGVDIRVGAIQAQWKGLRPRLTLTDVAVYNAGETVFVIGTVTAEISLLSSLRDWRLALRRLRFSGLAATLVQNPEGQWWVRGLAQAAPPQPPAPVDETPQGPQGEAASPPLAEPSVDTRRAVPLDDPLDIFLFGRRLELSDTRLEFIFRSGQMSHLEIPRIRLENDVDFHRLTAQLSLDEGRQSLYLVVEGRGDPRDSQSFDARGYVQLQQFPSEKVLAALGIGSDALLAQRDPLVQAWRNDGRVNLDLWFAGTSSRGLTWHGNLDLRGSPLQPPPGVRWPESLTADISGAWRPREGWRLQLANAQLWWPDMQAPPLDLELRGQLGGETRLAVASLDLDAWSRLLVAAGVLQGGARSTIETLQPRGRLYNLDLRKRPADQGHFSLRAQIEQGSVQAWIGAPAVDGISGLVEASAQGGQVYLHTDSGFSLFFPLIYHQPLVFTQARGSVRWEVDPAANRVGVSSSRVQLANQSVAATGQFLLDLPLHKDPERAPEMTLVIGAEKGEASLHRLLVPFTVPQPLYEWLGRSIEAGELSQAGFIYRGALTGDPAGRAIQLRARVTGGQVAFDPQWPALRDARGTLYLDDEALLVSDLRGRLGEVAVTGAEVSLEHPAAGETAIRVHGHLAGDGRQARALLDQSPLRLLGGEEVASWRWQGPVSADVDLLVPLSGGVEASQEVQVQLADARLIMPGLDLEFENIRGAVDYSSAAGLSSPGLEARLWGQDLRMVLSTQGPAERQELVGNFTGTVDMLPLRAWSERPELTFTRGLTSASGRLTVPMSGEGDLRLVVESSMEGVTVDVPGLLTKAPEQLAPVQVQVDIGEVAGVQQQRFTLDLKDRAQLLVLKRDGRVEGVDLAFGAQAQPAPAGQFRVRGQVEQLDAIAWGIFLTRLDQLLGEGDDAATEDDPPLEFALDLQIDRLSVGDLVFPDFGLSGGGRGESWQLVFDQAQVAGNLQLAPDRPAQLNLSRLHLPGDPQVPPVVHQETPAPPPVFSAQESVSAQAPPPAPDFWDQLAFADLPQVDLRLRDLRRGVRPLGNWSAKVRPTANGVLAYDLQAEVFGLTVTGVDKPGAELVWLRTAHGHTSYFSGVVEARDLAESFRQVGLEPALTSDRARFQLDLQWPVPPARLSLEEARGLVQVEVERGLFIRSGGAGENPLLKLIGLLNFDTLARRLRLDFSDLSAAGLGYETIRGELLFDSGVIRIADPLEVATPSSDLQLVGNLDARAETLDAQLVATLPLAGNLTVAAAVTGGVPLAVGVYLTGKLFKKQVERMSSLRYRVRGTWDEPEVRLERIFESRVPGGGSDGSAR
jgi:uncharacterized protein (TIGR02099 family)